ncbi:MAG TPA: FxSxx-COOH system tetratricopeptide repeat protein [Herpetosiphonaceae bacterium]
MIDHVEEWVTLGSWVRRRRKALDLTQAVLADRVGCAVVTIRKIEVDAMRPSRTMAERLARCLDLSPDEQAVFLQVACGQRGPARLPIPYARMGRPLLGGLDLAPHAAEEQPQGVAFPLDTLPPPAPLPLGSRMPLSRNPLFVGRDAALCQLAQALAVGGTAAIGQLEIAAATGLGGIGKTQLACEFVHRYGQFFAGGIFWLSFADPAAVPAEVAACGGADGMNLRPEFGILPLDEQVKLVLAAWASAVPRLLVFDNCEEEALLQQWRPKHGGCHMLITSRRHYWNPALGMRSMPLDVMSRTESVTLLRAFRPDLHPEDVDLDAIADELGDLPLALHLAGSFLAKYRHAMTSAQYLGRLRTPSLLNDRSLQAAGVSPTQHVQHVARTFEQSYKQLDPGEPTDALARRLLAHAAYFAPGEPLPRSLLFQTVDPPEGDLDHALLAEDALTRLIDLGLLETDAVGNLRLHRLLVAFVQTMLGHEAAQATVEVTMLGVADGLNEQRTPRPLLVIQPHLRFIVQAALPRADARAARLCNALGEHVWLLGAYAEAWQYHEQSLVIRERVLGQEHPATAWSLYNLGRVRWMQGNYAAAQGYYEQAFAIQAQMLGQEHPETAWSLNSMGIAFMEQGEYGKAWQYHEQALVIRQRVLGPDHPSTAASLDNLGCVLLAQGAYGEAQGYCEQALAIRQRLLGVDHPDMARSFTNLGVALGAQGQYTEAQRYVEQALAIRQRVLGPDHPDTARSLNNLGFVLEFQGRYEEAQGSYEQALVISQRVLGKEHPATAQSLTKLGSVLQAQGQDAAALHAFEQALDIYQRVLGPDHPETARSLRGLGDVRQAQGQYLEAQKYCEQALAIMECTLGMDHPDTLTVRTKLVTLVDQRHKR